MKTKKKKGGGLGGSLGSSHLVLLLKMGEMGWKIEDMSWVSAVIGYRPSVLYMVWWTSISPTLI